MSLKNPREKYLNDPEYNHLVNMLTGLIEQAKFTPSELREACILASINYELRHIRDCTVDPKISDALKTLEYFVTTGRYA